MRAPSRRAAAHLRVASDLSRRAHPGTSMPRAVAPRRDGLQRASLRTDWRPFPKSMIVDPCSGIAVKLARDGAAV